MKLAFSNVIRILSSLKLTISVLILIIISSIPATLIIQKQTALFYLERYSQRAASIILRFEYDNYFSSLLFISLITIFFINLLSCTLKRFVKQLKKKGTKRFGPDILHLGLLILIVGAMISLSTREEGVIFMGSGDSMLLPSGRYMNIEAFEYERYSDGRPKDWISSVNISESPETRGRKYQIQVNTPLRIDNLVIYQSGYRPSQEAGRYETGLLITMDKGKPIILLSFIFLTIGLFITFFQKRKDL